jgi:hypothetical protein
MKMHLSKKILYQEHIVNRLSSAEIGKKYGWTDKTIRKLFKKFEISYTHGKVFSGEKRRSDILDERFGKLIAKEYISSSKDGRAEWLCLCDCGNYTKTKAKYLKNGDTKSCGKCKEIIPQFYFYEIKKQAEKREIEFKLTKEYLTELFISQNHKCKLSGLDITMPTCCKEKKYKTASLDRIDSNIGYIENNVQWVHKNINYMKMDLEQEIFIELCKKITEYQNAYIK